MTLFTMLLVIIAERLFKLGEHWHLDHRLEVLFRRIKHFSMLRTLLMMAGVMVITFLLLRSLYGLFFNVPLLVVWILLGVLCIVAGKVRLHYHAYLKAASRDEAHARGAMASELDTMQPTMTRKPSACAASSSCKAPVRPPVLSSLMLTAW